MSETNATSRMLPRHSFVLIVHGSGDDVTELCAYLKARAIVRETTNPYDAVEALTSRRRAAILCYLGTRVHAKDFENLVDRTTQETDRIVFIEGRYAAAEDIAYLRQSGRRSLPHRATPEQVYAAIQAVMRETS